MPSNSNNQPSLSKKEQKVRKEALKAKARLRRKSPKFIILMGLPASGKSTFSANLIASWEEQINDAASTSHHEAKSLPHDSFVIANQDKLGKKACVSLVSESVRQHRIIIDRCNPRESDRQEWIEILNYPSKNDTALLYFATCAESCIERAMDRIGHETIPEGCGERIINDLARRLEPPTEKEKNNVFGTVVKVENFEQCNEIFRSWGCR
jgi:tRNA uridine 5-carbamoylmethylation protein Kti12